MNETTLTTTQHIGDDVYLHRITNHTKHESGGFICEVKLVLQIDDWRYELRTDCSRNQAIAEAWQTYWETVWKTVALD
jgi:hypothetical protein